jgi:Tol biopolymer transport system component
MQPTSHTRVARVTVLLLGLAAMSATALPVTHAAPGTTERVSVANDGAQGDNISSSPAISGDGRFVAFVSNAPNLVPGDTNGVRDIFVHDRAIGTNERVSVSSSGAQANGASTDPGISADGTTVVFFSAASNLVAGDTNSCSFPAANFPNCPDIFAHTG